MSSQCGSADILEALGVKIDLSAESVAECIENAGIGFMFAQVFHPAMKYAAPVRKEIGIRTVFNILGPLTNPAKVEHILLGVPSEEVGEKIAAVLQRLGIKHALVVHGKDGLDEISISGKSIIWDVTKEKLSSPYEVSPKDFGFNKADIAEIKGRHAAGKRGSINPHPGRGKERPAGYGGDECRRRTYRRRL